MDSHGKHKWTLDNSTPYIEAKKYAKAQNNVNVSGSIAMSNLKYVSRVLLTHTKHPGEKTSKTTYAGVYDCCATIPLNVTFDILVPDSLFRFETFYQVRSYKIADN